MNEDSACSDSFASSSEFHCCFYDVYDSTASVYSQTLYKKIYRKWIYIFICKYAQAWYPTKVMAMTVDLWLSLRQ